MKRVMIFAWCIGLLAALLPPALAAAPGDPGALLVWVRDGQTARVESALGRLAPNDLEASAQSMLLATAIAKGRPEVVKLLLDWGMDANQSFRVKANGALLPMEGQEPVEITPLLLAVSCRAPVSVLRQLMDAGAELDRAAEGLRPLNVALSLRAWDQAEFLLDRGADVAVADTASGWTPLMELAMSKEPDARAEALARRLVATGAKVDVRSSRGMTALRWAVEANNVGMVRALFALGADPNMPDDKGETPRDVAQRKQRLALIQILDQARQAGSSF